MLNFGFKKFGLSLPKQNLLFYSKLPNGTGADADKYVATAEVITLLGSWWETPRTMTEILADAGTNIDGGFVYAGARGVATYSVGQIGTALVKLSRYFKFALNPADLSGWVDESGSLWADGAGSNWNV